MAEAEVIRVVKLNLLPLSGRKGSELSKLVASYSQACSELFFVCSYWDEIPGHPNRLSARNVQKLVYKGLRARYGLQAQLVIDLIKDAVACYRGTEGMVQEASPSFNIPRSGAFCATGHGNPVLSVASFRGRLGLPVAKDGSYERYMGLRAEGYGTTHFRLAEEAGRWVALITLRKECEVRRGKAMLGVDVGSRTLAAITVHEPSGDRVLKQMYFGRDVWVRQRDLCVRRSRLKSHADLGSARARKKLRALRGKEGRFDKTRCYQVAHEIVRLAKAQECTIAIEDLKGLKESRMSRKSNRRVKRMPYGVFQAALESVAARNGIEVLRVSPRHTSQRCPRCGSLKKSRTVLHRCRCGYEANRDRMASHNIALAAERISAIVPDSGFSSQHSKGDLAVNPGVYSDDGGLGDGLHPGQPPRNATRFSGW